MLKEVVASRPLSVSESFNDLNLGEIAKGSEGYRALGDVVELRREREEHFASAFGSDEVFVRAGYERIYARKEEILKKNEGNEEYTNTFGKVWGWADKGYWEDGLTCGSKLRFLEERYGFQEEPKKPESKRLNLRDIFRGKKTT